MAKDTLPHPVARAIHALLRAHTSKERYEALLEAAETLAITISVTTAALLYGYGQDECGGPHDRSSVVGQRNLSVLKSAYLGKGTMFGTWTAWLDGLRSLAAAHPDLVPGLLDALQDRSDETNIVDHLNALREERNRAAHGNKPQSQAESALRLAEKIGHLESALIRSQFLTDLPWLLTISCEYRPRYHNFDVLVDNLMGSHPDFDRRTYTWADPVGTDMLYILSPKGPISLSPFAASLFCSQCRQTEICYAYRVEKNGASATLKSFGRGHDIHYPGLGDEILSLPSRQRNGGKQVRREKSG